MATKIMPFRRSEQADVASATAFELVSDAVRPGRVRVVQHASAHHGGVANVDILLFVRRGGSDYPICLWQNVGGSDYPTWSDVLYLGEGESIGVRVSGLTVGDRLNFYYSGYEKVSDEE